MLHTQTSFKLRLENKSLEINSGVAPLNPEPLPLAWCHHTLMLFNFVKKKLHPQATERHPASLSSLSAETTNKEVHECQLGHRQSLLAEEKLEERPASFPKGDGWS
jgi:hypothetical protein